MNDNRAPSANIISLYEVLPRALRPFCAIIENWLGFSRINKILLRHAQLPCHDFLQAVAQDLAVSIQIDGEENLIRLDRRPVIFYANHPWGGMDA